MKTIIRLNELDIENIIRDWASDYLNIDKTTFFTDTKEKTTFYTVPISVNIGIEERMQGYGVNEELSREIFADVEVVMEKTSE